MSLPTRDHGASVTCLIEQPDKKDQIMLLLQRPGNNKLPYYCGHGVKPHGALGLELVDSTKLDFLSWSEVRAALILSKFNSTLTMVLDSCFAGVWAMECNAEARNPRSEMNRILPKLMVTFHLGCAPHEFRGYEPQNGKFTKTWL